MFSDYRVSIKRLLLALCVWDVIVLSAVVVVEAHIHHRRGLPYPFHAGGLILLCCLLTPLGVITILPVSAISKRLPRLAASLLGFVIGGLMSVVAGYVVGVYLVGGFEGGAGFMGMGLACALPSAVASAIAGCLFAKPLRVVRSLG
jgi:hypothetical protein